MFTSETEIAKSIFKDNGPSELLSCIDKDEKLSPEAEQLLIDIGANMLTTILDDACFSSNSRGSKVIEKADIQFICDPWIRNDKKQTDKEKDFQEEYKGSNEYQAKLAKIQQFRNQSEPFQ